MQPSSHAFAGDIQMLDPSKAQETAAYACICAGLWIISQIRFFFHRSSCSIITYVFMKSNTLKFKNKYRIASCRLRNYDYGATGFYFITINIKNRRHHFGKIVGSSETARLAPTDIGLIAIDYWQQIPEHHPFVVIDAFIVMPDHMHGILYFDKPEKRTWQHNRFGPQSENLASVIRSFKSSVKRYANQHGIEFAWQPNYHDHVIRNKRALNAIRKYIINNPKKWVLDLKTHHDASQETQE